MAKKSQSFEQSITRLDEIVRQLEQGNVPLEDALKLFQEGTALVDTCGKLLDKAELEVVKLMKTADGTPTGSSLCAAETRTCPYHREIFRYCFILVTSARFVKGKTGFSVFFCVFWGIHPSCRA